jgi:hypothetical protein
MHGHSSSTSLGLSGVHNTQGGGRVPGKVLTLGSLAVEPADLLHRTGAEMQDQTESSVRTTVAVMQGFSEEVSSARERALSMPGSPGATGQGGLVAQGTSCLHLTVSSQLTIAQLLDAVVQMCCCPARHASSTCSSAAGHPHLS